LDCANHLPAVVEIGAELAIDGSTAIVAGRALGTAVSGSTTGGYAIGLGLGIAFQARLVVALAVSWRRWRRRVT